MGARTWQSAAAILALSALLTGCLTTSERPGSATSDRPRSCPAELPVLPGGQRAGSPGEFVPVTARLAAARRDPAGRSARQLLGEFSRLGAGVLDDPKAVNSFYSQLNAEDLRAAGRWRRSREGRALDWFALQPTLFGLAGTDVGPVTAEGKGKRSTLTGRDLSGRVRWRRRLPAGLADIDLHAAADRVIAVAVASRHPGKAPAEGDLLTVVLDARTGRVQSCRRREFSSKGVQRQAVEAGSFLPRVDSALDPGGRLLVAVAAPKGTSIEALDGRDLRRRWTRRLDWRVGDLAAGGGLVAVSRDPEVVDDEVARASPRAPQMVALASATGRTRWTVRELPSSLAAAYGRAPANLIAAKPAGGAVVALVATSAVVDDTRPVHLVVLDRRSGRIERLGPSLGQSGSFPQLALAGGAALVKVSGPKDELLLGVDPRTARPLWKRMQDAELDTPPAVVRGGVLPAGFDQAVIAPRDGRARPLAMGSWFTFSNQAPFGRRVLVWDASLSLLLALRPEALPAP